MKEITIAPSDFAFLFDESPWAFHQKYVSGIRRPPLILPKIFNIIDSAIKNKYANEDFTKISSGLPAATLRVSDKWIKSKTGADNKSPKHNTKYKHKNKSGYMCPTCDYSQVFRIFLHSLFTYLRILF